MSQSELIKFPFGAADVIAEAYAAVIAVDVNNTETVLTVAQLTGASTLNLTVNSEMPVGANLTVKTSVAGTNRTLTLGTGFTGAAQVLTASKSYALSFKFDGSKFVHTGTTLLN